MCAAHLQPIKVGLDLVSQGALKPQPTTTTSKFLVPEDKKKLHEVRYVNCQRQRIFILSLKLSEE